MRIIYLLLVLFTYQGCEKDSDRQLEDCKESIQQRLGLTRDAPGDDCNLYVTLHEADGAYFYYINSSLCFVTWPPYNCDGSLACDTNDCNGPSLRDARFIEHLGYLPSEN